MYNKQHITYTTLPEFLKKEAIKKIEENTQTKLKNKDLKADIKDLQRHSEEQNEEYLKKERQIYTFLECKKTFLGKVKYFFKTKKNKNEESSNQINKQRMKEIISQNKNDDKLYDDEAELNKSYTVEDMIKICKELNESMRENKNIQSDIKALKNKIENLDRKIKNATQYIEEIEKHKKSIFEFWKFANKDEVKSLEMGDEQENKKSDNLKKTFNYEDDIYVLANSVDRNQREKLTSKEIDATFAANFVLDGINIMSKKNIIKADEKKVEKLLENLKSEYKENLENIEKKDFDIFGNVSEDKTKVKVLNNNMHRETEKDKFKVLNLNLDTQLEDFTNQLLDLRKTLENESNKIKTPYDISVYKASIQPINTDGFGKFDLNPQQTLSKIEDKLDNAKNIYLYKINIPEKTNIIFYSNIIFYENTNETLPLGMDISQETLINMDLYKLNLKNEDEFNINVSKNDYENFVRNVKVYEYDVLEKNEQG